MASFGGDDASKKKSIVVMDMPVEFINRDILKAHFEQFGTVERLACSVSKRYAVIHFSTMEQAENAAARGTVIRADAPHLKIVNRGIGSGSSSQRAVAAPPPPPPTPPTRTVLRRKLKIVNNPGGGDDSATPMARPQPSATSVSPEDPRASSNRTFGQVPVPHRSPIRLNRSNPFLKKRSSFGDKVGGVKHGAPASRNPFAHPPRNMLSLDRRKTDVIPQPDKSKSRVEGQASTHSAVPTVTDTSNIKVNVLVDSASSAASTSRTFSSVSAAEWASASAAPLPDDDEEENEDPSTEQVAEPGPSGTSSSNAVIDIDETTEDANANEDESERYEDNYDDTDTIEPPADTQDTAEATTEEEGELNDDEDEQYQDEEIDDEAEEDEGTGEFESPMRRAQMKSAASSSTTAEPSSGGSFSFKVKPTTSTSTDSSAFKTPFASPFSFANAPKPFSSSSFGKQFGASGSSIFAGGATASKQTTSSSSQQESATATSSSKESVFPKSSSSTSSSSNITAAKPAESKKPSASQYVFGGFPAPSFGGSASKTKPTTTAGQTSSTATAPTAKSSFSFFRSAQPTVTSSAALSSASSSSGSIFSQAVPKKITPSASTAPIAGPSTTAATPPPPMTRIAPKTQPQTQSQKDGPNPLLLSFYPDTSQAQELFAKVSSTVEERYRILEARDKLIRARVPKTKVNVEFATKLIGTCPDMCPEKERYMRQFQRQLVFYETLPGPDFLVDHQKAVKAYSRSSADQEEPLPHELRPGPTLDFTMHYLLRYIVPLGDNPDENLSDWYNFLWDRTRSIRKDITQQQIVDLTAVSLYEKCTRLHIHCASRLCELDVYSFDPKLNDENLMKCLQSLEHLYDDLRRKQVTCPNEPEFRAYQIMMNLNEGDALYNAQQLPSWILNSDQVQTALKFHHSIFTKNFVAFFQLVAKSPYMTSCIMHRYFFQVRSLAIRCFMKSYCTLPKYETMLPMSTMQRMLGYGPDQVMVFSYLCESHGIHCDVDEGRVFLKRKMFYRPDGSSIYRENYMIDSKLRTTVAEAINGGQLPDIDFANHTPHSSFTESGQLIQGNIVGGVGSERPSSSAAVPTFAPPEISSSSSRFQSKPALFSAPSGSSDFEQPFSFGLGAFQKRKEPPVIVKPKPDIEAVCQTATTKLIEESVKSDVAQLSYAQLEQAKLAQEEAQRKQLRDEIATRVSLEYVERIISSQVENIVRDVTISKLRQQKLVEELSRNAVANIVEETVSTNLGLSVRTELILAQEHHQRLMIALGRIFQRLRARLALGKWIRFTTSKKLKRELEEKKRHEVLWNFPPINSYALSTKDVFHAFCGRSSAQPILNKVELLSSSPENMVFSKVRPKRKSDGDTTDYDLESQVPRKLPRLASGTHIRSEAEKNLWNFPVSNPYTRTNREVLEAFCGSSSLINLPSVSSKTSLSRLSDSNTDTSFRIHRPARHLSTGMNRVGAEIRSKANESIDDLLKNIKNFTEQVKEEKDKLNNLQPYVEEIETMEKSYSELSSAGEHPELMEADEEEESMMNDRTSWQQDRLSGTSFLSGVFLEEDELLRQIKNFAREVRVEKAASWNTDTFLNQMDIENIF